MWAVRGRLPACRALLRHRLDAIPSIAEDGSSSATVVRPHPLPGVEAWACKSRASRARHRPYAPDPRAPGVYRASRDWRSCVRSWTATVPRPRRPGAGCQRLPTPALHAEQIRFSAPRQRACVRVYLSAPGRYSHPPEPSAHVGPC